MLQWDKDDCAAAGLVKFDLLGLGMLSALHYALDLVRDHRGYEIDLATLPQDDDVYEMLCRADTIGVFQVESRAQMATLPRLRPRTFYDLVVEVALIRPGPIQGGSVHPYIRRRNGQEAVTYPHPLAEACLARTLGVPLFQEQLMQLAIDIAGFTPAESDELRQAMGSKRSAARMERLRERLFAGMAERGITGEVADDLYVKMRSFANYGFPESHSVSFAYLVYASAYLKYHEPAAFCAALLNAQPMGFWSPHTLVRDARRHGVRRPHPRPPRLARRRHAAAVPGFDRRRRRAHRPRIGPRHRQRAGRGDRGPARCGWALHRPRGPGAPGAGAHPAAAGGDGRRRRVRGVLRAGAPAGAVGGRRRRPVATGAARRHRHRRPGPAPARDDAGGGSSRRPVGHRRRSRRAPDQLPARRARQARRRHLGRAAEVDPGSRVVVAGVVTHRQRPMTAQGTTFLNLEDETGLINVVVSKGCWSRFRRVAREAPAMTIRGRLERSEGVINVVAEHLAPLALPASSLHASRDFR